MKRRMKFITREQVIKLYFKSSGRFGPADDIVDFAGELENLIVKAYSKEIIDTARWAMKPDTI